jgi:hypothetical protein
MHIIPFVPYYLSVSKKSLFQIRWLVFQLTKSRVFFENLTAKMEREMLISLDSKFQQIPTYHDKNYNTCKNLKIGREN